MSSHGLPALACFEEFRLVLLDPKWSTVSMVSSEFRMRLIKILLVGVLLYYVGVLVWMVYKGSYLNDSEESKASLDSS